MGFLNKKQESEASDAAKLEQTNPDGMSELPVQPKAKVPFLAIFLGLVASIGGFMFGYESGQISGKTWSDWFTTPTDTTRLLCHAKLRPAFR